MPNFPSSVDFGLIWNMNSSSTAHQCIICEIIEKGSRNQTAGNPVWATAPLLSPANFGKYLLIGFWRSLSEKCEALIIVIAITNHDLTVFDRGKAMLRAIQYLSALIQISTWFWLVGKWKWSKGIYLKQQAENESNVHAAKGDLGRYGGKTKTCVCLGFCFGVKCKMGTVFHDFAVYNIWNKKASCNPPGHSEAVLLLWIIILTHD